MAAVIIALNVSGWGIFVFTVMPQHFHYEKLGVGLGVAITAWTLGLRHAFDADHISAIDNVTRKLMADGRRPLATGFFFALGHSTIIVAVGVGISIAARAVFGAVVNPSSTFETSAEWRHRAGGDLPVPDRRAEPDRARRDRPGVP
jgi:high-affinity nickel-transport protein